MRSRCTFPRPSLFAGGALVAVAALLAGAPVLALLSTVAEARPAELGVALARAGLPALAVTVLTLACLATGWALAVAVPEAWLVTRTDVPGARLIRWLAPLPLAIPPYVAALGYASLLGPGGDLHRAIATWLDRPLALLPWPRIIYGTGGAAFVLGVFTAPYVFLIVQAALARTNASLEAAARSLGCGPWETFRRVTLPLLGPAIVSGSLLVFLYACVDFGVVSLLRARTVTTAVYAYLLAGYSPPAAAAISLGLVVTVWLVLAWQGRAGATSGGAARHVAGARSRHGAPVVHLGGWRWAALLYCVVVLALALVIPVAVLVAQVTRLDAASLGAFVYRQLPYLRHSLVVAVAGASAALALGLALAMARRARLPGAAPAALLAQAGYAIPGTVLGLALVGLLLRAAPSLYGTPVALVLAYVVLFTAPAYQSCGSALAQVSPTLEAAARGLGRSPVQTLRDVVLPLAAPGLLAGWSLTFALAVRELAASIILRPAGYDTLAVRIWVHTMDVGPDPHAATVALLLLAVVAIAWLAALVLARPRAGEAS